MSEKPTKPLADPNRMTRNAIALVIGMAPSLVARKLALPGAPQPDANRKYDFKEVEAWLAANSKWAASTATPKARELKDRKLELEVEEQELRMALIRGDSIRKADVME